MMKVYEMLLCVVTFEDTNKVTKLLIINCHWISFH